MSIILIPCPCCPSQTARCKEINGTLVYTCRYCRHQWTGTISDWTTSIHPV